MTIRPKQVLTDREATMSVWLVRAGAHGEYEEKFLREGRVYVTWDGLDVDLLKVRERSDLIAELAKVTYACCACAVARRRRGSSRC